MEAIITVLMWILCTLGFHFLVTLSWPWAMLAAAVLVLLGVVAYVAADGDIDWY